MKLRFWMFLILSVFFNLYFVFNGLSYPQNQYSSHIQKNIQAQWEFNHMTVDNGLSNNHVRSIAQDKYGYVWIATSHGLNRFSGIDNITYFSNINDSTTLSSNSIISLYLDTDSNIWVGTDNGLHLYDYKNQNFKRIKIDKDLKEHEIYSITEDHLQNLIIGTSTGLYIRNNYTKPFVKIPLKEFGLLNDSIFRILVDEKNNLWLTAIRAGLYYFDRNENKLSVFRSNPKDINSLSGDWIIDIYLDKNNDIWLGTFNSGFCKLNKKDSTFTRYVADPKNDYSKRVRTIFEDRYGRMFVGTRLGLYFFDREREKSILYANDTHDISRLSQNSVTCSAIDRYQNVWLGTHSGGVTYFNMRQKEFIHYSSKKENNRFLNSPAIHCFNKWENKLYIGSDNGINILDQNTGVFTYLISNPFDDKTISYNDIKAIAVEAADKVWVATNKGGINLLNKNNKIKHIFRYNSNDPTSLRSDKIYNLLIDRDNTLWVISMENSNREKYVVSRYNRNTGGFQHYQGDFYWGIYESDDSALYVGGINGFYKYDKEKDIFIEFSNDTLIHETNSLYKDAEENIWIGNNNGLAKYNPLTGQFLDINKELGLGIKNVFKILGKEDELWFSVNKSLFKLSNIYNTKQISLRLYSKDNGLQSGVAHYNSFFCDDNGNYYLGGNNGFVIFHPDSIRDNPYPPNVYFSALYIEDTEILPNEKYEGKIILERSILETNEITVKSGIESFSIYFDIIHYSNSLANKYKYRLNKKDDWTYADATKNSLTFRGLTPGVYQLEIYGINSDGIESKLPALLKIIVRPSFWQSIWFRLLLVVFIVVLGILIFRLRNKQLNKQKQKLQKLVEEKTKELVQFNERLLEQNNEILEQKEEILNQRDTIAEKTKQLEEYTDLLEHKVSERTIDLEEAKIKAEESDRLKTAFLENMSHEIRTPLNAIIGFSDIIGADINNKRNAGYFEIIKSSGYSLISIIDNIIDFSKIESGTLVVNNGKVLLENKLDELLDNFKLELEKNNKICSQNVKISIKHKVFIKGEVVYTDVHYFEQIFNNLLSNAIKFTHKGVIVFGLEKIVDDVFTFYVKDTGIGIVKEEQDNIFLRFIKLENKSKKLYRGGGLGLSISKQLVELLGGCIYLDSEKDKGSTFYFTIKSNSGSKVDVSRRIFEKKHDKENHSLWKDKVVLIVEDEISNFELLNLYFSDVGVKLFWAKDGLEAIKIFSDNRDKIDLVLMDIKLPVMTGYEASEKIKEMKSDVPIIVQSAYTLTTEVEKYIGKIFDDYILKPIEQRKLFAIMQKWIKK